MHRCQLLNRRQGHPRARLMPVRVITITLSSVPSCNSFVDRRHAVDAPPRQTHRVPILLKMLIRGRVQNYAVARGVWSRPAQAAAAPVRTTSQPGLGPLARVRTVQHPANFAWAADAATVSDVNHSRPASTLSVEERPMALAKAIRTRFAAATLARRTPLQAAAAAAGSLRELDLSVGGRSSTARYSTTRYTYTGGQDRPSAVAIAAKG